MRLWQKSMIALARSEAAARLAQRSVVIRSFARRYVAGRGRDEAVERVSALNTERVRASLFYLGEYVEDPGRIRRTVVELRTLVPLLAGAGVDVHISVDPTQLGSLISWDLCRDNTVLLAKDVKRHASGTRDLVMLDMEDSSVTEKTIDLHDEMRARSLPVGITIQAYLHRSVEDLDRLADSGATVRLVKGAFAEGSSIAYTTRPRIDEAYRAGIERFFSGEARRIGVTPVLGTHDHRMVQFADRVARANGWRRDEWEIEMLLGVRPRYQRELVAGGFSLRLYTPFGESWWPYAARRIGESPRNLWFILRSLAQSSEPHQGGGDGS